MKDSELRALELGATTPEERAAFYAQLAREGRLGSHWAAGLSRVDRLHYAAESPRGASLVSVLIEDEALTAAAEGRLLEVLEEALGEARRLAKEEWAGKPGIFHALAALEDRKQTRVALGIKRLPSVALIKGQVYGLREWELRCCVKRMEREGRDL